MISAPGNLQTHAPTGLDDRVAAMVDRHFHPDHGAPFWIERAKMLGLDARRAIRCFDDLRLLGDMDPAVLAARPMRDFVPSSVRHDRLIVVQTGGSTQNAAWTAFRADEFHAAFVAPFAAAAHHVGFPRGEPWLYIGPSGPHAIGKAAAALATALASSEPFTVDFDPRWAKRLPPGSFALERYLDHVVSQATDVLAREEVGVLFTTPAVLPSLAERMTRSQRERIRGVHYGGLALDSASLARSQRNDFPCAVHLSGYGNTLFGCALELSAAPGRIPAYFPGGDRLVFEVVDEEGRPMRAGERGRVRFTRLDETVLLVRVLERDEAFFEPPPRGAPVMFTGPGLRDPQPARVSTTIVRRGLY